MNIKSDDANDIAANVLHSTESAIKALSQLEESLVRGRFKEGVQPYEIMCKTLMGQKLWASDVNDNKLDKNFSKIASLSENIIDILKPYVDNLQFLTSIKGEYIDELYDDSAKHGYKDICAQENMSDSQLVLDLILAESKKKISFSKLRTVLGWDRKRIDKAINQLKITGQAQEIIVSSRKMISLN